MDRIRQTPRERLLVLIADDDETQRALTGMALESAGFAVVAAESGARVVDLFAELDPDALLLDVMMPGIDGFEACRLVRAGANGAHCPIIMVTGLDDTASIDRAYEVGATDFITKPINWTVLGYRVRYVLRAAGLEAEAATAHARLKDAIDCFPAVFHLFDAEDRLVLCNAQAHRDSPRLAHLFTPGTHLEEILRASAVTGELVASIGRPEEWLRERRAQHQLSNLSEDVERSDGRWLRVIERRTTDGGRVALRIDITELKEREKAMRAAKEEAELANRAKAEFLANISHELRTPLNAIIGFSELLRAEPYGPLGAPQYRDYMDDIWDSGTHLLQVINDILDMSRIESGKLDLNEEQFALDGPVASCLRLIDERAGVEGLTLESDLPRDLPCLHGDKRLFRQMLLNLLTNAVKFTPKGGTVAVSVAETAAGGLVVAVRDTGIGIAADDIPKVLQPFGQADGNLDRKHEGTGLGLPLVAAMIRLHGGELRIESEPGAGTTASLEFPPARVIRAADADERSFG
jgi:signal transduction histidine kinase